MWPPWLQSIDAICTRLFFDRVIPTKYPCNVLAGFEPSAGATFFNLNGQCQTTQRGF